MARRYHEKYHPNHLGHRPSTVPAGLMMFRRRLDNEESAEVVEAWDTLETYHEDDRPEYRLDALAHLLHELADRVIVAYGTADAVGVRLDDVVNAVMRANMRKVPPAVSGGKATKPGGWTPADDVIRELVRRADRQSDPFAQPAAAGRSADRHSLSIGPVFTCRFDSECGECGAELCEGDEARMFEGNACCLECTGTG